jgi:aspartate/methionine/tyrosine aminotransferase
VVKGLNAIPGVSCRYPAGAFYAFPNISSFGRTSKEIADYLLTEANVALLRGTSFGAQGEGFLRISYASSRPVLEEALVRIREALARL